MEKIYYDIATKVKLLVVKEGLPTSNHPDNMNLMLDRKSEDLKDIRDEIASIKSLITKPVLKKSSKFQNAVSDLNDALSEFEKLANAELKKANPKAKKIKVKKYKV